MEKEELKTRIHNLREEFKNVAFKAYKAYLNQDYCAFLVFKPKANKLLDEIQKEEEELKSVENNNPNSQPPKR